MTVDIQTVEKLAELSKLEFDEAAKKEIIHDLNRILGFIEKLNELDTKNVEPLIYMNDELNSFREDEERIDVSKEQALKNAPDKDSDYFRVPKVLNK
jgi:aspartyl-tRNA(Asn)/glutamyl-tRNA(Gln) amidotransferase subunit C